MPSWEYESCDMNNEYISQYDRLIIVFCSVMRPRSPNRGHNISVKWHFSIVNFVLVVNNYGRRK